MPGASPETRRVRNLNANWKPGSDGGEFEFGLITEDEQRVAIPASPAAAGVVVGMVRAGTALAWDPINNTLIVANLVGTMPWTEPV